MINITNEILEDAKIAYKESVLINNDTLEEQLLSIIGNAKLLLHELQKTIYTPAVKEVNEAEVQSNAIAKVKKRVPLWLTRPHQKNYKILVTYMELSENDSYPILLSLLENNSGLDSREFISHYNQMKSFADKAHGKIFEEENRQVRLWKPVSEFIVNLFQENNLNINNSTFSIQNKKFVRDLQSVGQSCFVKYFDKFNSNNIDRSEIIETLKRETDYTDHSCESRASHARSIIKSGFAVDALNLIVNSSSSKVDKNTRIKAQKLISQLAMMNPVNQTAI